MSANDYLKNMEPDPADPGMTALAELMHDWHEAVRTEMEMDGMSAGVVEGLFIRGFLEALPAALTGEQLVKLIVVSKNEFAQRRAAGQMGHEP